MKFTKQMLVSAAAALLLASGFDALAQERVPAFPGAEGFGRYTTGGRGGNVYHVTNLNDAGTGSLRWALSQPGPRTIVFDVSGTIHLQSELRMQPNTTIAGQTAPGDGICIADYPVSVGGNSIIRYVRFRLGNKNVTTNGADGFDGLSCMDQSNVIIDHCSVSWSIDECCSVLGNSNTTLQWSIVAHSLVNAGHSKGAHGYGGNWGGSGASFHHNLVAHHGSRTPRLGPRPTTQMDERMDMRNNVIYNFCGNGCYGGEGMNVNIVNNYYKPGPGGPTGSKGQRIAGVGVRTIDYCLDKDKTAANFKAATGKSVSSSAVSGTGDGTKNYITVSGTKYEMSADRKTFDVDGKAVEIGWNAFAPALHMWGTFFVEGNVNSKYNSVTGDNWGYGFVNQIDKSARATDGTWNSETEAKMHLADPIDFVFTTTHSADEAYSRVLDYVGASLHRDSYDAQIVADARDGVASFTGKGVSKGLINSQEDLKPAGAADNWSAWPALNKAEAPVDSDKDGIPDDWELANGLNPNDKSDGNELNSEGYTMLEVYLASLVADITSAQNAGGTAMGDIVEYDPVKEYYDISVATRQGSTWNFEDGISISNTSGGSYVTSGNFIGFGRDIQQTVVLPERAVVNKLVIEGRGRYSTSSYGDASLVELNGKKFEAGVYALPKGDETREIEVPVEGGAKGTLTMTWSGNNPYLAIRLYTDPTSDVEEIDIAEEATRNGDDSWYNLQGIRIAEPTAPGIYIHNGKKIFKR